MRKIGAVAERVEKVRTCSGADKDRVEQGKVCLRRNNDRVEQEWKKWSHG